jgi:hypothetical protein
MRLHQILRERERNRLLGEAMNAHEKQGVDDESRHLPAANWRPIPFPMTYLFPLESEAELAERIDAPPPGVVARRWVVRDDNQQHYHGVISLDEDPLYVELRWKATVRGQEQVVGTFRLHLARLLAAGYVRRERDDQTSRDVRLRFYRGERGVVYIQESLDRPALPIGVVDATLG